MDPERFHYFVNTQQASLEDLQVEGKSSSSQKLFVFSEDTEPRNKQSLMRLEDMEHTIFRVSHVKITMLHRLYSCIKGAI